MCGRPLNLRLEVPVVDVHLVILTKSTRVPSFIHVTFESPLLEDLL
jgi:hypothetical protein